MTRTIVVTGSASGIGRATASLLSAARHRVIGVDLHHADVPVDLSTPDGRAAMLDGVRARCGGAIDAVVACAGVARPDGLTVSVNYFGATATLEGLRPLLEGGAQSRAMVISSITSALRVDQRLVELCLSGDEGAAVTAADGVGDMDTIHDVTKAAVARWVHLQAVRPEWAGKGILLNALAPGLVDTPMTRAIINDPAELAEVQQWMPIDRYAQPDEVARLISFLVSPENSYMVGQVVFIDGGMEASGRGDKIW